MKRTRLAAVAAASLVVLCTFLAQPGSADPVAPHGTIAVKGPGNSYSIALGVAPAIAVESVAKGSTAQFELRVTNSGTVATPYAVALVPRQGAGLLPAAATLSAAQLLGTKVLPTGPNGFVTPSIAAGKSATYMVKVPTPKAPPAGHWWFDATLRTPDGTVQQVAQLVVEQRSGKGSTAYDMFVSQGSQPYVGSSSYQSVISTPALLNAQSATFNVKLQNNGPVEGGILLQAYYRPYCEQITGRNQFGYDMLANPLLTYPKPTTSLKPGQSNTFKITLTRPKADCLGEPPIFNVVELRAARQVLGQTGDVSMQTYHSVLLVAPYAN